MANLLFFMNNFYPPVVFMEGAGEAELNFCTFYLRTPYTSGIMRIIIRVEGIMEERHEIIKFPQNLRLKVFLHRIGSVARHWHRSLEMLLVLEGTVRVSMDEQAFVLGEGGVVLINSNSIHGLSSEEGAVMIGLQFRPELFRLGESGPEDLEFNCNSAADPDSGRYDDLRWAIAQLVLNNVNRQPGADYRNYGICYYLLAELASNFRVTGEGQSKVRLKYTRRLSEIMDYIEDHYREDISLGDLAASQQLSVPYLSAFFSRHMGVKFTQYYTDVKLDHALRDLTGTDHTVERVAADNGFPEIHAFIRAFKARFGVTPSAYRKRDRDRQLLLDDGQGLNYLAAEPSNYFHILRKYLPPERRGFVQLPTAAAAVDRVSVPPVSVERVQKRLVHNFKNVIGLGRARDLLNHDIRQMLRDLQSTVGYRYVKFHGILSDDMMVCGRLADGTLQFRYQMVDSALEFLLSIGLKPIVQLSFMPAALASDPGKTVFYNPFNTSPPRDMGEWNSLVGDFTRHLIVRFGREEVVTWPFCVWCEPETSPKMFGFGDFPRFCDFYKNTYDAVKSVCPDIRFGTPALLYMRHQGEPTFLTNFIRYTLSHGCRSDFMNIHYYSDIIPREAVDLNLSNAPSSRFPTESDDFARFITAVRELFGALGVGDLPVYLTEWNLTFSHRNLISDTCFKSCYILKNLLENYDRLDSFGYWSLTDLIEENPLPDDDHPFHGGLGVYTMSGVRKSVFYAFDFANRLGDELLAQGDGYFVTRKGERVQVITYHYVHYGDLFAAGDAVGVTATSRYAPFDMSRRLALSIPLTGMEDGRYVVREYFVNREYGSAYDLWVKMGAMPLSTADSEVYSRTCVPGFHAQYLLCEGGRLTYSPTLEPLEIRFAEIVPERR